MLGDDRIIMQATQGQDYIAGIPDQVTAVFIGTGWILGFLSGIFVYYRI